MKITKVSEIRTTEHLSGFVIEEQTIKDIILKKQKRTVKNMRIK